MHPAPATENSPAATRQRLLEAARQLCRTRGLQGATTREIATAAGVNEVTLFRHFGSKEKLLAALFQHSATAQAEAFASSAAESEDLAAMLREYAQRIDAVMFEHEPLIRTMLGEAHRYPEEARQIITEAARPLRLQIIATLRAAQKRGEVRAELALDPLVDALTGMLLAGMLKRTAHGDNLGYTHARYLETCVDLFLHGILVSPAPARRQP